MCQQMFCWICVKPLRMSAENAVVISTHSVSTNNITEVNMIHRCATWVVALVITLAVSCVISGKILHI